jgi:RNA polymerase sigma-70 factor (ECF subfamily)
MGAGDLDLVRRCVEEERGAWDEFVRRTRSALMRGATIALRKFRSADAENLDNVQQQVYVELLRDDRKALRSFRGKSDLEGWVSIIAMRTAFHLMRSRKPEVPLAEFLPAEATPAPGESAERSEFLDRLDAAFRKLGELDMRLLRLSYFEQKSYKEIADDLGLPLNSVSPMLIRAKEKLKKLLE